MLSPSIQEPVSLLKVISANNAIGGGTSTNTIINSTRIRITGCTSASTEQEDSRSPSSKTNTNKHQHTIGGTGTGTGTSRRSTFTKHLQKQHSDRNSRSLDSTSIAIGNIRSCPSVHVVTSNNNTKYFPTRNIVNQALDVMSNSLKDVNCVVQQLDQSEDSSDNDNDNDNGEDDAPTDNSSSDNDNDNDEPTRAPEPTSSIGTLTAQPSFRKIAKKRRKAGGRISFHHTKSSKEYLRKAQEAYQRLKISEQEQQNDQQQQRQPELQSVSSRTKEESNSYGYEDPDASTRSSAKSEKEPVDYGYGDPADSQPQEPVVDYGYGDPTDSQPQEPVDYGYGDPAATQPQQPRRGGRPRRRNSVTKFSAEAANVVAAKAAAERILRLKPSLTSMSRGPSTIPTRQRQKQQQRSNAPQSGGIVSTGTIGRIAGMQTMLHQQQEQEQQHEDQKNNVVDKTVYNRPAPPQRSCRHPRDVFGNKDSFTKHSSDLQEPLESQQPQQYDGSSSLQTITSAANHALQLTSDYLSPDPKPKSLSLFLKNSSRSSNMSLRFNAPIRTESWLSHDNSYSTANNNDDDDADSLASDMESLCGIRDKNTDLSPVPPVPPPASPLIQASPSSTSTSTSTSMPMSMSRLTSADCLTRFSGGRSSTSETNSRKSLVISWSNSSNKDGSLSHFATDKVRGSRERKSGGGPKFPILPFPGIVTTTSGTSSKSCMPAPVNRTPSYTGSQRQD